MDLSFDIIAITKDHAEKSFVSETEKQQKRIENIFYRLLYKKKGKKCWQPQLH